MFSKEIPFDSAIKVSFFDKDGTKVNGISIEQANKVHELDQDTLFYFKTGDGTEKELTIEEVRELPNKKNILPSKPCDTGPKECGPPLVRFFGGGGFGAAANAIISPISSSVIGFDVVNRGKKYKTPPNAELVDPCGKGSGSSVVVTIDEDENSPDFGKIDDVIVIAPGDGYISAPDGSLGGNDRVWKEPDEGWCETPEGGYCVVQPYRPIKLPGGSTYHPPDGPPRIIREGGELITIDLVPVKPPDEEEEKNTSDPKGPTDLIPTGPTPRRSGGITPPPGGGKTPVSNSSTPIPDLTKPGLGDGTGDGTGTGTGTGTGRGESEGAFKKPSSSYPVYLCLVKFRVIDPGFGYRPGDKLIVSPNLGVETELIVNEFGQVTEARVIKKGCGFVDIPKIRTNSSTGFNATFVPIFSTQRLSDAEKQAFTIEEGVGIVDVVDCVGIVPPKQVFDIVPRY